MVGHSHTVPMGAKCGNGLEYLGAVVGWGSTINKIIVADLDKGGSTPPVVLEDIYWSMCNALLVITIRLQVCLTWMAPTIQSLWTPPNTPYSNTSIGVILTQMRNCLYTG